MMTRKLTALALSVMLVLAIFAGCASGSGTSGGGGSPSVDSLKVWLPPFGTEDALDKAFWDEQLAVFAAQKGISINLEITPWGNYEEKYLTGISSGDGPDVGYMYLEMIADYINMDVLVPLEDYLTAEDKANYIYLANGVVQGKQYMLPFVVGNPRILFCNMDILEKSGLTTPPKTWDELVAYGLKIKEDSPDINPFIQGWAQPSVGALNVLFWPYLWQAGGEIITAGGDWVFNSDAGVRAVEFAYSLMHEHKIMPEACTSYEDSDITNLFLEGRAAMIIGGSSLAKQFDDANINWDFVPSLSQATRGTFVAADALVLLASAKDKDLAFEAMRFITSGSVMAKFHEELAPFPPIGRDEPYNDHPRYESMFTNEAAIFNTLPAAPGSSMVFDALYKNLQLVMLGQMSAKDALDQAVEYAATIG